MKRSEYEKQQELLRKVAASNPLAAEMMKIASDGMRELVNGLAENSDTIQVNGLTLKRGPNGFEPVFDEDKH